MAARRKTSSKRAKSSTRKNSRLRSSPQAVSAHRRATEKMLTAAFFSIAIIAFVVWFSQDFQAEGQAYRVQLELESQDDIALAVSTSCQTQGGCTYVHSVATSLGEKKLYLHGEAVDPYQLVYYTAEGSEVSGATSLDFARDDIVTVGYLGKRYPVDRLSVK